ncbi:hypothetical protein CANINC_001724 [Pichia inconspicua]|uniref:Uncharacterized protein n=1 Tax=Pichia inconspicua TaxID=52247 RepID=A0A4T0X308_9ASCO|nr:hypothetical protein CANINC_001724 [[Candida] inconspicua]
MSAFEDYCIVCEKLCVDGSAYCSDTCKHLDQENDIQELELTNSPALSASSFELNQSDSNSANLNSNSYIPNNNNNNNHNNISSRNSRLHSKSITLTHIPKSMVSPLLTPQIVPVSRNSRNSIVGSIKSPNFKDLTYESPLLATSNSTCSNLVLNDLDSNRLDLNIASASITTISERLSQSIAPPAQPDSRKVMTVNNIISANHPITNTSKKITNVSNLLQSSSENYKKWLSIH